MSGGTWREDLEPVGSSALNGAGTRRSHQTIRASVGDVQFMMAISIGLVVLVMFLFLRNSPQR
jgi:multidrug efflux pump subunit AcrB